MSQKFQRFLSLASVSDHAAAENWELERISPSDLNTIKNLSDYDSVVINLSALCERKEVYDAEDIKRLFNPSAWRDVLLAGGRITIIGDPDGAIDAADFGQHQRQQEIHNQIEGDARRAGPTGSSMSAARRQPSLNVQRLSPLRLILTPQTDRRPIDYRRVRPTDDKSIQTWLDFVLRFDFSWQGLKLSKGFAEALNQCSPQSQLLTFGQTSFQTNLAIAWKMRKPSGNWGWLILLPPTHRDITEEENRALKTFLGVELVSREPEWAVKLKLPGQHEIAQQLSLHQHEMRALQEEIREVDARLNSHKRWFRLLYADGGALENIVKEALEMLGASVVKKSKVKDDFRVSVTSHTLGVMEVKGTHNAQFNKGAIRQLAGWMDEANAEEQLVVKGLFVGNNGRQSEPSLRSELVEHNIEEYAKIKDIVLLRAVDLYCVVILSMIHKLDTKEFWNRVFATKGLFDATDYWKSLPSEFAVSSPDAVPEAT